ncbi:MAG: AAA family ATPase [Butyrivibrio sp.]|nr:AAA family ATPase [Butyrivibrio sp.]
MKYLLSFKLSSERLEESCPHIYPYSVFRGKDPEPFVFSDITVLYGNNGSGKSTILNIMANKLKLKGGEHVTANGLGRIDYTLKYNSECSYDLGEDENTGKTFRGVPKNSMYVKSEDILYEIKKIQQRDVLAGDMLYDRMKQGQKREEAKRYLSSYEGKKEMAAQVFAQEKYSNGETALQILKELITPDALFLLDEPEVSLSPANQVAMAEEINKMARFLGCQFIIATHSPFLLGTLNAKIYNLDISDYRVCKWYELENVRYFYNFFKERQNVFE